MNLPQSGNLDISIFERVLKNTTTSYKFYWLLAILKHLKQGGNSTITFNTIVAEMVSLSWNTVIEYKVSLGLQDKIPSVIDKILKKNDDDLQKIIKGTSIDLKELKQYLICLYKGDNESGIRDLTQYVPYRFLQPFFPKQSHSQVKESANKSFYSKLPCPYRFEGSGKQKAIVIHPLWQKYFVQNSMILEDFIYWNLVQYLQARNPNVPNISLKVLPPDPKRGSLSSARKAWRFVLDTQVYNCIYSNQRIVSSDKFALDHFIPWSFVAHDMLWNLIPTLPTVNSSKNNKLPDLDSYFLDFAKVQHHAFKELYKLNKTKALEDYILLFKENATTISAKSENDFCQGLRTRVTPLIEIAANSGFEKNWTYKPSA